MKRLGFIPYIITLALLSGCGGRLFSSRLDMEHLRPIQTIALDRAGEGVRLGVSSGSGPGEDAPLVLICEAAEIESAVARLQSYADEDELFYAHVQYILPGESVCAGELASLLDWVERSPCMRMDTALLPVRGSAVDALAGAAGEKEDATGQLAALEGEERLRGDRIVSLREAASSLLERGWALCLGVRAVPTEGVRLPEGGPDALVSDGLVLLREDAPAVWLSGEEALGAELLTGKADGAQVELDGCVLELLSADAEVSSRRDENGALTELSVRCALEAGMLERNDRTDAAALETRLAEEAERWIRSAVGLSRALGCDLAELGRAGADVGERLPDLPVSVTAQAVVSRSYDLAEPEGGGSMRDRAVSPSHASAAVTTALLSPLLRLLPRESAALAGRAAWLSPLPAAVTLLLLAALLADLRRRSRPGEGAAELALHAGGPVFGRLALLLYAGWFLFYTGFILRSGAERLTAAVYGSSGVCPFLLVMAVTALILSLGTMEALGRMGRVLRAVLLSALGLVFVLAVSNIRTENLFPLRREDLTALPAGALPAVTVGGVAGLLFFLGGYTAPGPGGLRRAVGSIALETGLACLLCLEAVGAFGAALTARLSYPFFTMIRDISLMRPAPRIEALVIVLWVQADLYLCALLLRCSHEALRTVLKLPRPEGGPFFSLRRGRWLLWLEALAAGLCALLPGRSAEDMLFWSRTIVPRLSDLFVFLGLPLLWLAVRLRGEPAGRTR